MVMTVLMLSSAVRVEPGIFSRSMVSLPDTVLVCNWIFTHSSGSSLAPSSSRFRSR